MKVLSRFPVLALAFCASIALAEPSKYAEEAKVLFNQRDFTEAGIRRAKEAADLYEKAAIEAIDAKEKAQYWAARAEALYFVGSAVADDKQKVAAHDAGVKAADQAVKLLGIADITKISNDDIKKLNVSLAEEQRKELAEAIYQRGANLGAWGQAYGVLQSLSKWPELRRNMEIIELIGFVEIRDYGAYRILGRGYFKIPALMGGDMAKAERYLSTAFSKTKAKGYSISRHPYNNIFYAELLYQKGDEDKAIRILEELIDVNYEDLLKAEPGKMDPNGAVEFEEAQRTARELLNSW